MMAINSVKLLLAPSHRQNKNQNCNNNKYLFLNFLNILFFILFKSHLFKLHDYIYL